LAAGKKLNADAKRSVCVYTKFILIFFIGFELAGLAPLCCRTISSVIESIKSNQIAKG